MSKLKLGIVGCGEIAGYVAGFALLNPNIQVAACCDINPHRANQFARRFRIRQIFLQIDDMLTQASLDAVYLAVPHHLHYPMLLTALDYNIPVWLEKPISSRLEDAVEIVRLARERDIKVGVNYQYRYDSGCYALARAVQQKDLGKVYSVRINLPWHREAAYFEKSPWHSREDQAGGGTLLTQGSHLLDIALWAVGERPVSVMGYTARLKYTHINVEDVAHALIEMASGALIQIHTTLIANPEGALSLEVYAENGTAIYTNRPWPRVVFKGGRITGQKPPVKGLHALQRSLEGFRLWVDKDQPYLIPAEAALPVLSVIEAIYRSAKSGKRESIAQL